MRKTSLLAIPIALGLMACNPFTRAERRLDNPKGSIADAQQAIRGSFTQNAAADIVSATTGSLTVSPFTLAQRVEQNPGIATMLSLPEMDRYEFKLARNIIELLLLQGSLQDATPYISGNIDVNLETGGQCTGNISFNVDTDIRLLAFFFRVDAKMDFENVVCPEGSINGFVGFRFEADADLNATASAKLVEVVEATISDNVQTTDVDFALRANASVLDNSATVDMSVAVDNENEKFTLTVSFVGNLETGEATLQVIGSDGEVTCNLSSEVDANGDLAITAACSNGETFTI